MKKKKTTSTKKQNLLQEFPEITTLENKFIQLKTGTLNKEKIRQQALGDATQGIPAANIQRLSFREQTIKTQCASLLRFLLNILTALKIRLSEETALLISKLEAIDPAKTANYYFNKHFKAERNAEYDAISVKYDGDFITKNEEKEATQKDLKQAQANATAFVEKNNGKRPTPGAFDKTPVYLTVLALLALIDVPIHFVALNVLGYFSGAGVLLLSFGLAFTFILTAHETGKSWQQKNWWRLGLSIIGICMLFGIVAYLRMGMDDLIMVLLNGVVVFLGVSFAYERSINREFFINVQLAITCRHRINKLDRMLKAIEQKALAEKKDIDETYRAKAEHLANDERNNLEGSINRRQLQVTAIEGYLEEQENAIQGTYIETINLYRTLNSKQRAEFGFDPVIIWENPPPRLNKDIDNRRRGGAATPIAASFLILLASLFGMSSCNEPLPQETAALVMVDVTSSHHKTNIQEDAVIADYITKDIFEMNGSVTRDFGEVVVSTIGEISTQSTQFVRLNEGKEMLYRIEKDRKKEITNFRQKIQSAIVSARKKIGDQQNSQVFRNLCQLTPKLIQSQATRKVMLIFSDMIENTASRISFYDKKYKAKPEAIMEDYDQIVSTLEQDGTLGDLNGIDIRIIHLPDKEHDEIFIAAKKFWTKLFFEQGATQVTFVANI